MTGRAPAVVVGIDGSDAAVAAALWAVEEAVSRDIPLRLLYAIEPRRPLSAQAAACDLATAEIAVRAAFIAVESRDAPVKVEVEIVQAAAPAALITASRSAALVCVGATGIDGGAGDRRLGSVSAAVVRSAHCPVAVVRVGGPAPADAGWVVVDDDSPDRALLLETALEQARLRHLAVRVVTAEAGADTSDGGPHTPLARQLSRCRRHHPDLDVVAVTAPAGMADYLTRHGASIALLVVGQHRERTPDDLTGSAGTALRDTDCSLLICPRRGPL